MTAESAQSLSAEVDREQIIDWGEERQIGRALGGDGMPSTCRSHAVARVVRLAAHVPRNLFVRTFTLEQRDHVRIFLLFREA
jgi:hypothetical protein